MDVGEAGYEDAGELIEGHTSYRGVACLLLFLALAGCGIAGALVMLVGQTAGPPQLSPRAPWGPLLPLTATEAEVQALPFKASVFGSPPENEGYVYVWRRVFQHGGYGVIDLGTVRPRCGV